MAKARGTDGSLLASLPWSLAAVAFALLPHVPFLPFWVTAAFVACGAWRYSIERRRGMIPGALVLGLIAVVCFIGVLVNYQTISGVGPGSALLAVMGSLKLLETRRRRDQFVLLFIALFLTMSSLLREQHLWSAPYLVVTLMLILTAWLRMSADDSETTRQSAKTSGRMMLYAAPIALAMWVFFPRISTPFWSVPIDTGSAVSGLSENMSPGDISSLSLSNAVAFRVYFKTEVPAQKDLYWRGLVLRNFDGRGWYADDWEKGHGDPVEKQLDVFGDPMHYQITMEPTHQQWAFALDMPYRWELNDSYMGRFQQLMSEHPIEQRVAYDVVSFPEYRAYADQPENFQGRYLAIDNAGNPRTMELARRMRSEANTELEYIRSVLTMFSTEEFYYTLQPPVLGRNPVDQFLHDTRQGFCEHYASAFALMMRAAGIPSRVVLGYQGGEMNELGDYMIVRQADAHAWTEVWLEGLGWRRFDPTAAVAPERVDAGRAGAVFDGLGEAWGMQAPAQWLYDLSLAWDTLNARWNEWILGYGPENQNKFMKWLGMDDPDWQKMMFVLLGLAAGFTAMISALMMYRNLPPRKDRAAILYEKFVRKSGLEKRTGETPADFAVRASQTIDEANVIEITEAYLQARYGADTDGQLERLKSAVAGIRAKAS